MKYAVAHIDLFEHDLKIEIVEASNWKEALEIFVSNVNDLPDDLKEAKEEAFNQDWMFAVKEVMKQVGWRNPIDLRFCSIGDKVCSVLKDDYTIPVYTVE